MIGEEIGRGRFGTVCRCYATATGERFALKTMPKADLSADPLDLALVEQEPKVHHLASSYYVAPEVLVASAEYTEKVDVWSAGVVLYVMLSGTVPFAGATAADVFLAVLRGSLRFPHRAFTDVSPEAKDLMRRMLCKDV